MLYYIGYYAEKNNKENRHMYLSAVTKMQYVIETLDKLGIPLQVVSCSNTRDKRTYKGKVEEIKKNVSIKYFTTFGKKNLLTKVLDVCFSKIRLFLYLLQHVKKEDTLLVYHSLVYGNVIKVIKWIKNCRFIFEIEEIYSDVLGKEKQKQKEIALCKHADAFIFPTEMLNKKLNVKNKPYVLAHGTYKAENERETVLNDNKTHVVYAGTFDPRKGGAIAAVETVKFLPSNYHVHILGFGNKRDTDNLKMLIEQVSQETTATISYDGLLSGEEYIAFLQKCQIGLSTQNPEASFNDTSFPSKILSYMANGLRVVTIRIPVVEGSAIGEDMVYYEKQTPVEIANAIMKVNLQEEYNSRGKIKELDQQFCKEIKSLLSDYQ